MLRWISLVRECRDENRRWPEVFILPINTSRIFKSRALRSFVEVELFQQDSRDQSPVRESSSTETLTVSLRSKYEREHNDRCPTLWIRKVGDSEVPQGRGWNGVDWKRVVQRERSKDPTLNPIRKVFWISPYPLYE